MKLADQIRSDLAYLARWKQKPTFPVIATSYRDGTIEHMLTQKHRFPDEAFRRVCGVENDLGDVLEALQALTSLAEWS